MHNRAKKKNFFLKQFELKETQINSRSVISNNRIVNRCNAPSDLFTRFNKLDFTPNAKKSSIEKPI